MQLGQHLEIVLSRLFYACGVKVSQSTTTKYAYMKTKRIANSLNTSPRGKYSYIYWISEISICLFSPPIAANCRQNCDNKVPWSKSIWKIIAMKITSSKLPKQNHSLAKDTHLAGNIQLTIKQICNIN